MIDETARWRARVRLALRAEQVFGLDAIAPPKASEPIEHPETGPGAAISGSGPSMEGNTLFPSRVLAQSRHAAQMPEPQRLSPEEKQRRLAEMDASEVRGCRLCRLCERRTNTVFGEGSPDARIFFIGEGPGETEDRTGRPFVGRAGELLNKMIAAMGLKREDVYIGNVVKCRPPGNREPSPDEVATCTPYLERQLEIVQPEVIVTLGRPAAQHMLQSKRSMSSMRGQWQSWRGIKLMPTFHPAYLLRSYTKHNREMVWNDLKEVMRVLGMAIPNSGGA